MTHPRLLLFKWLMVLIPPVTVAVGHILLTVGHSLTGHTVGSLAETLLVTLPMTLLVLVLSYLFVETLFGVLRRLQAEALAREQDILTMNAVMRERERLSRELHDGVAQLVAHCGIDYMRNAALDESPILTTKEDLEGLRQYVKALRRELRAGLTRFERGLGLVSLRSLGLTG